MKLLRNRIEIGGQKYTETQILEKALIASEAIILNGFNSAEELYNLLKINCLDSSPVMNKCLTELSMKYNDSVNKESEGVFFQTYSVNDKTTRDAHIANIVLMGNKIKIIADVRSFLATKEARNLENLPIFDTCTNYVGFNPSMLSIDSESENMENVVNYKK